MVLLQTCLDAWQVSEDSASTEESHQFALRQLLSAQPLSSPELQLPKSCVPLGSSAFHPWLKLRFLVLCLGWPREEAKLPVLPVQALGQGQGPRGPLEAPRTPRDARGCHRPRSERTSLPVLSGDGLGLLAHLARATESCSLREEPLPEACCWVGQLLGAGGLRQGRRGQGPAPSEALQTRPVELGVLPLRPGARGGESSARLPSTSAALTRGGLASPGRWSQGSQGAVTLTLHGPDT